MGSFKEYKVMLKFKREKQTRGGRKEKSLEAAGEKQTWSEDSLCRASARITSCTTVSGETVLNSILINLNTKNKENIKQCDFYRYECKKKRGFIFKLI